MTRLMKSQYNKRADFYRTVPQAKRLFTEHSPLTLRRVKQLLRNTQFPSIPFYWGVDDLLESKAKKPTHVFRPTHIRDKYVDGSLSEDSGETFEEWGMQICDDGTLSNNCISGADSFMLVARDRR